jgi:hypothetical protein
LKFSAGRKIVVALGPALLLLLVLSWSSYRTPLSVIELVNARRRRLGYYWLLLNQSPVAGA